MAGIGFELRRLVAARGGLVSKIRAYSSAGLIASGPWIMTALTLCLVSLGGGWEVGGASADTFRSLVTYAFAFSLITVGAIQMAVTRWVADRIYAKEYDRVMPAFTSTMFGVGILEAAIALGYGVFAGWPGSTTFLFACLYVTVSLIWVALIWLTVIRRFDQILLSFALGTATSVLGISMWGAHGDVDAYLASYAAGQALTLVLLVRLLIHGMNPTGKRSFESWSSVIAYPALVGSGLAYSLGIWVDKMLFWFVDGVRASGLSYVSNHPLYDTCCFLAYVTVIPALSINLIHLETSFYEHYRGYYNSILNHMPLQEIADKRKTMFRSLRTGIIQLVRIQGAVTVLAIVLAPWILASLGMPEHAVRTFRLCCLGSFFHVLLLILILVQSYFDLRKETCYTALTFLVTNAGLTLWSIHHGFDYYGAGYAIAALISCGVAFGLLDGALRWLDYETFVSQLKKKHGRG